ncbi:MAG TPA: phosphoribosylamine--glycine ligase [Thermoplasmata archaeon]|nr:phosphoribosylamine--glycine ligase [Thermoplasmata archaeon]
MRVLVVGGGGREHAIVEALRRGGAEIIAAMANQNPGIARAAKEVLLGDVTAVDRIVAFATDQRAELAVVGPEAPLERGLVDALEARGIPTVGPTRTAAQLETNKEFTRDLMKTYGIPGLPSYWAFDSYAPFSEFVLDSNFEFVIKPLGLTGGKGVQVWGDHFSSKEGALAYGRQILEKKIGGQARFLVEEKLVGEEFSLQALCDGKRLVPCPLVQDHKRAYEGDRGPNTGGMGSYSDADHLLPFVSRLDYDQALDTMRRTVEAMQERGTPFKGILYGGFMATKDGPKLLEYNVRFADPESMNVLPILEDNFIDLCMSVARGGLPLRAHFAKKATVCKYVVPPGYGTKPKAGEQLKVDEESIRRTGAKLYYAAVDERDGKIFTTTSRSLAVVGIADDLETAEGISEEALAFVGGSFYARRDIGKPEVVTRKVEKMQKIRSSS